MTPLALVLLLLLPCELVPALVLKPSQLNNSAENPVKVLVFGDSWGSLGPSFLMLRQMFETHHVKHIVHSTAVAGTSACHWARQPNNLASASRLAFGFLGGPDFIWLSSGANDLLYPGYLSCSKAANSYSDALQCALESANYARDCNKILLDNLFKAYPKVRVVQCGYDIQCASGKCVPFNRWPYCVKNVSCANHLGLRWGHRLIDPLVERYGKNGSDRYTGIFVEGSCQRGGNFVGASVNHPIMERESPCNMMLACVHPIPGTAAAISIGESFWAKYFATRVRTPPNAQFILPTPIDPPRGWEYQTDSEAEDFMCNKDWYPDLEDPNMPPPPCNRTLKDYGYQLN